MERTRRMEKFGTYALIALVLYGTMAFFMLPAIAAILAKTYEAKLLWYSFSMTAPLIYLAYHLEKIGSTLYYDSLLSDGFVSILRGIVRSHVIYAYFMNLSAIHKSPENALYITGIALILEAILLGVAKLRKQIGKEKAA